MTKKQRKQKNVAREHILVSHRQGEDNAKRLQWLHFVSGLV
jgi:hypothetical protein